MNDVAPIAEAILADVLELFGLELPGKFPRAIRAKRFTDGKRALSSSVEFSWENPGSYDKATTDMVVKIPLCSGANVVNFDLERSGDDDQRRVKRVYWTRFDPDGVSLKPDTAKVIMFLDDEYGIKVEKR